MRATCRPVGASTQWWRKVRGIVYRLLNAGQGVSLPSGQSSARRSSACASAKADCLRNSSTKQPTGCVVELGSRCCLARAASRSGSCAVFRRLATDLDCALSRGGEPCGILPRALVSLFPRNYQQQVAGQQAESSVASCSLLAALGPVFPVGSTEGACRLANRPYPRGARRKSPASRCCCRFEKGGGAPVNSRAAAASQNGVLAFLQQQGIAAKRR